MGVVRENQKRETTQKILKAALEYFAYYSFHGAKLDDISKKAGVTNGLIVQRFGSRDNLFIQVFNEVIISSFPSIRSVSSIKEGLLRIIKYAKNLAETNEIHLRFSINSLYTLDSLPKVCKEEFYSLFADTDFERIYKNELRERNENPDDAFVNFVNYVIGIFTFTFTTLNAGSELLSDDSYIGLFNRWNRHKLPDQVLTIGAVELTDYERNLRPFEIKVVDGEGELYLTDELIKSLDVDELLTPREKFLYFANNMNKVDTAHFVKSVEIASKHKNTNLGLIWKSDTFDNSCFGMTTVQSDDNGDSIISCFIAEMYNPNSAKQDVFASSVIDRKLLQGIDILMIESNRSRSKIDKMTLEKHGAKVVEVFSASEAINGIKKGLHFDLIIIDDVIYRDIAGPIKTFVEEQIGKGFYIPPIGILTDIEIKKKNFLFTNASLFVEVLNRPLEILDITKLLVTSLNDYAHLMASKLLTTTKIANTDALTKVKNATAFSSKKRELDNLISNGKQDDFALIVIDIDSLKGINDTHGHSTGDVYIKNCSKIICETFSHSPVYRIGGDEFVVVLDRVDYSYKDVLIRRFSYKIDQARQVKLVGNGHASMSYGVAVYNKAEDKNVDALFARADAEMYKHKKKYKNKLVKTK